MFFESDTSEVWSSSTADAYAYDSEEDWMEEPPPPPPQDTAADTEVARVVEAARAGDLGEVQRLVRQHPNLCQPLTYDFTATPLHVAVRNNDVDMVRFLIDEAPGLAFALAAWDTEALERQAGDAVACAVAAFDTVLLSGDTDRDDVLGALREFGTDVLVAPHGGTTAPMAPYEWALPNPWRKDLARPVARGGVPRATVDLIPSGAYVCKAMVPGFLGRVRELVLRRRLLDEDDDMRDDDVRTEQQPYVRPSFEAAIELLNKFPELCTMHPSASRRLVAEAACTDMPHMFNAARRCGGLLMERAGRAVAYAVAYGSLCALDAVLRACPEALKSRDVSTSMWHVRSTDVLDVLTAHGYEFGFHDVVHSQASVVGEVLKRCANADTVLRTPAPTGSRHAGMFAFEACQDEAAFPYLVEGIDMEFVLRRIAGNPFGRRAGRDMLVARAAVRRQMTPGLWELVTGRMDVPAVCVILENACDQDRKEAVKRLYAGDRRFVADTVMQLSKMQLPGSAIPNIVSRCLLDYDDVVGFGMNHGVVMSHRKRTYERIQSFCQM